METVRSAIAAVTSSEPEMKRLFRLRASVNEYDWGKVGAASLAARLAPEGVGSDFKIDPSKCYSEMWMGTHAAGPASLFASPARKLSAVISTDPAHYLGSALLERWPDTQDVPFLFKVLSIAKALPLQAHPDKARGARLHRKDPGQFVDANHKPEIAVALGGTVDGLGPHALGPEAERIAFTGFVGFQPLANIQRSLEHVPELRAAVGDAAAVSAFTTNPTQEGLKKVYGALLARGKERPDEIRGIVEGLVRRVASAGWGEAADEQTAVKSKLLVKVNEQYPGDVGVLAVPLFMNLVRLRKGDAIYIGADEIHAYLEGDIIECMAVSDNVVNSAFVPPAERDIGVFTDMLTYTSREPSHWSLPNESFARSTSGQTTKYSPPLEEFDVLWTRLEAGKSETLRAATGPTIGLVLEGGAVRFACGDEALELPVGGVVYITPGNDVAVEAVGGGEREVWWATCSL